jgi:hypothetical protein
MNTELPVVDTISSKFRREMRKARGLDKSYRSLNQAVEALSNPKLRLTSKKRKGLMRSLCHKWTEKSQSAAAGEKYITKLSTLQFRQLLRRLKQAARIASHWQHMLERNSTSIHAGTMLALQDNALLCLAHIKTEIEYRTSGKSKGQVAK